MQNVPRRRVPDPRCREIDCDGLVEVMVQIGGVGDARANLATDNGVLVLNAEFKRSALGQNALKHTREGFFLFVQVFYRETGDRLSDLADTVLT